MQGDAGPSYFQLELDKFATARQESGGYRNGWLKWGRGKLRETAEGENGDFRMCLGIASLKTLTNPLQTRGQVARYMWFL